MKNLLTLAAVASMAALCADSSRAAFALVDDMEGPNNWSAFDGSPGTIVTDPADPGNMVFSLGYSGNANQSDSYLSLGTGVANDTTATLFFRVRSTEATGAINWVFGSSDVANPGAAGTASAWGDFEGYGVMNGGNMSVRNGGAFTPVGVVSADTWYNVWLILDNTANETTLYFNTGDGTDATAPGTLSSTGAFRNGTTDSLITLWARNNQGTTTGYLDDVYLDTSGANLVNPVPEPSAFALLGCGIGALLTLRRRR